MAESTLTPEERQKIYKEEKTRIEVQKKIEKEKEEERNRPAKPVNIPYPVVWLIIIGLIVFFVVLVIHPPSDAPPTRPDELPSGMIGAEARLQLGDGQYPAWVSKNKQTYKELMAAVTAHDTIGYNKLLYSGRIFSAITGTKVLVLESGLERTKVRILEGNNYGRSDWVPRQAVH